MDKQERIKLGKVAEDKVFDILDKHNITYKPTSKMDEWSPRFDQVNGDVFIYSDKVIKADVKRGAISLKSIDEFKGDVFIISDWDMEDFYVIPAHSMRKYKETCVGRNSGIDSLSSGDPGIKFYKAKLDNMRVAKKLEDWIQGGF